MDPQGPTWHVLEDRKWERSEKHWRLNFLAAVCLPPLHLVEANEGSRSHIVLLEELDTALRSVYAVHQDVIQCSTGSGDCYIKPLIYGSQVPLLQIDWWIILLKSLLLQASALFTRRPRIPGILPDLFSAIRASRTLPLLRAEFKVVFTSSTFALVDLIWKVKVMESKAD